MNDFIYSRLLWQCAAARSSRDACSKTRRAAEENQDQDQDDSLFRSHCSAFYELLQHVWFPHLIPGDKRDKLQKALMMQSRLTSMLELMEPLRLLFLFSSRSNNDN